MAKAAKPSNESYQFSPLPNELDDIDSSTYHFRLYMIPIPDYRQGLWFDRNRQITIAESGKTTLIIEDVEITATASPNGAVGMSQAFLANFKIIEPHGAVFFDRIHAAAQELGTENYTRTVYMLELSFKGRNKDTSYPEYLNKKWVWPLNIIKVDMNVTASGSEYNLETTVDSQLALSNQFGDLGKNQKVTGSTVPECLRELSNILDNKEIAKASNSNSNFDKYEFQFHGDLTSDASLLKITNGDDSPNRQGDAENDENGKTTVQLSQHTSILSVIDALMMATPLVRKEAVKQPTEKGVTTAEPVFKFRKLYRVFPEVIYLEFDEVRNEYQRKFVYHIAPYETSKIITTKEELDTSKAASERNLKDIISKGVISKHYQYIFTGLNDQILDFDLSFNMLWYAALPQQAGLFSTQTSNVGKSLPSDDGTNKAAKQKRANSAAKNSAKPKPETATSTDDIEKDSNKSTTSRGFRVVDKVTTRFIDDYESTSSKKTKPSETLLPITRIETTDKAGNDSSVETSADAGKAFVSSMFTQMHEDRNSDLLTVDLNIKGDPFWLLDAPYMSTNSKTRANDVGKIIDEQLSTTSNSLPKNKVSDVFYMFTSQTPTVSAAMEQASFTQNTVINGIYQLVVVKSKFSDGVFTQILESTRSKTIDLRYVDTTKL